MKTKTTFETKRKSLKRHQINENRRESTNIIENHSKCMKVNENQRKSTKTLKINDNT